jgi:RNA polymerase sigma-70 factor (ECF subfamily)
MIVAYIREGQHLVAQGHEASANDKFSSAFEVLVRHYQRAVVGFCVHMLRGSVERVEDIAQEVFLAAWKTMPQFRHEASIRTWVFAITRHHCWDAVRQMGPNDVADESGEGARRETPAPVPPPDEQYAHHNLLAWVRRGLARLHSDDREVLVMTYMTELPPADIAHLLGITEAGVRTRRKRALQRLREIVTHED